MCVRAFVQIWMGEKGDDDGKDDDDDAAHIIVLKLETESSVWHIVWIA